MNLRAGDYLGHTKTIFNQDGLILSEASYHAPVYDGWHPHENCHFSLVLDGGNHEHRISTSQDCTIGKLLFYYSDEKHRNDAIRLPNRNVNLELTTAFLKKYSLTEQIIQTSWLHRPDAAAVLLRLYIQARTAPAMSLDSLTTSLFDLFALPLASKANPPNWALKVVQLLQDQRQHTISLDEIASTCGVHPITISKNFPKYIGCTVSAYQRKIRVANAITMIRAGDTSLTEIGYACGFFDQSHFIRTFKEETGVTPNQFRRLQ